MTQTTYAIRCRSTLDFFHSSLHETEKLPMKRMLCLSVIVGLCYLPGCGGGGGEAEFDPSAVSEQTGDELQEEAEYEKFMEEQDAANEDGPGN